MPIGGPGGTDTGLTDDDFIDVKFPNPNNRPNFGDSLSVGGNPLFAGKGFGGGGFGIMDIGGSFTGDMMGSNPNFTPELFGLPTTDRKTGLPIDYGVNNLLGSVPGGYENTSYGEPGGYKGEIDALYSIARKIDPMNTLSLNESIFNSSSFTDPSGIGSLSPTTPAPFESQTGIFGGTLGPKLKNAIPPNLRKFLGGIAKIHPATMNAVFLGQVIKGYQGAKDKGAFLKKVGKSVLMRKAMSGANLSSMQKQGIGSLMNVARGKQNWQQELGGFATNAAFSQMMQNFGPKAYQSGGMPAVYALMSAVKMMRQRAQRRVRSGLAGPGGGG
mgnify:FL=1